MSNTYIKNLINRKIVAELLLISVTFFWGITFIMVKFSIEEIPVFVFLAIRFIMSSFLTLPFFLIAYQRKELKIVDHFYKGSLIGFILWTTYAFQTIGLAYTSSAVAAFLTGLNVVFTPILGIILFRLHIQRTTIIASLLAFTGVAFLSGVFELDLSQTEGFQQLLGNFLIILCAIGIAFHILFTEKYAPSIDPISLLFFQFLISSILSLGSLFLLGDWNFHDFNPFLWSNIVWITLIITV
ncbi:MAG: DMT family transporter, partial [Candidatus Hodarchaeales archaeon]